MERLCLFMSKPLTANLNIDASLDKFRIPKDVAKAFEESLNNIKKILRKSKLKSLMHIHTREENNENLEKQKLILKLRKIFTAKEIHRLIAKFTEEQLKKSDDPTAKQLFEIIENIRKKDLDIESIVGYLSHAPSESNQPESKQIKFSENEQQCIGETFKNVEKLLKNYNKKNKTGQSKTIVYDEDFIKKNLTNQISDDSEKVIVISDYYSGTRGNTKNRKAANEVKDCIEKYKYTKIPKISEDEIKKKYKDIMIPLPEEIEAETYLKALRKILELNKNQYERTYTVLGDVKGKFRRVDKKKLNPSLNERIETVRKYKNILKEFIPMLKEFIAENPKHSKILKSKATELINQYENETDLWEFLNSYQKITYDIKYDKNNDNYDTILLANRDLDTYYKDINNLVVTAIKAKSIKKVFECVSTLDNDYNSCKDTYAKLNNIKEAAVRKNNTLADKEIINYQKELNNLAKSVSKNIDSSQKNMDKLKRFYETYKKENSLHNRALKKSVNVLQVLALFTRLLADITSISKAFIEISPKININGQQSNAMV